VTPERKSKDKHPSRCQFVEFIEQRSGPPKDRHVEALGKPAIDVTEQVTGFNIPSLIAPEEGETRRGSQVG
jgi:hypothetical protein